LLNIRHWRLAKTHNLDVLFRVLATSQLLPLVEQVEQFPAIDLVETNHQDKVRKVSLLNLHQIMGGQIEESLDALVWRAHHRESFAATRLSVGEARCVGSFKSA
jgi:hypothetical protein